MVEFREREKENKNSVYVFMGDLFGERKGNEYLLNDREREDEREQVKMFNIFERCYLVFQTKWKLKNSEYFFTWIVDYIKNTFKSVKLITCIIQINYKNYFVWTIHKGYISNRYQLCDFSHLPLTEALENTRTCIICFCYLFFLDVLIKFWN